MRAAHISLEDAGFGGFFESRAVGAEANGGDAVGGFADEFDPVVVRRSVATGYGEHDEQQERRSSPDHCDEFVSPGLHCVCSSGGTSYIKVHPASESLVAQQRSKQNFTLDQSCMVDARASWDAAYCAPHRMRCVREMRCACDGRCLCAVMT